MITSAEQTLTISGAAFDWLACQRPRIGQRDFGLLLRAVEVLEGNIIDLVWQNEDGFPRLKFGISPSLEIYKGVWNWDSAFHAVAIARWNPELARQQVQLFLDAQLPSGALPDVLYADGRAVNDFGKPPVMPWASMAIERLSPCREWVGGVYPCFKRYEAHWRADRGGEADGLFHYDALGESPEARAQGAKYESGWDTSVRWDNGTWELWPIDLNCYMVMLYRSLVEMANILGEKQDADVWALRERALIDRIETALWDDEKSCYCDVNRLTGHSTGVLTPAAFMPLYIGIAPLARAASMAALAACRDQFCPGMPTVSYSSPEYNDSDYWRGPTWLNTAYFAWMGLLSYGYADTAEAGKETIMSWCASNTDALYEYYSSRDGQGLGARSFGWTAAFLLEFILNF